MEYPGAGIKGIYRDRLVGADGQVSYDSGWSSNKIAPSFRVLLAAFLRHDTTVVKAEGHELMLKVGRGHSDWDTVEGPPDFKPDEEPVLLDPYNTPLIGNIVVAYLDEHDQEVTQPTHRLQITATLGQDVPSSEPCPLREFALFVQFADSNKTLCMVNCVRHRLIYKAETDTLIHQIRLTF